MQFEPKLSQKINKTLYISQGLVDKIYGIATKYNTSFSHVVVDMIQQCLDGDDS